MLAGLKKHFLCTVVQNFTFSSEGEKKADNEKVRRFKVVQKPLGWLERRRKSRGKAPAIRNWVNWCDVKLQERSTLLSP